MITKGQVETCPYNSVIKNLLAISILYKYLGKPKYLIIVILPYLISYNLPEFANIHPFLQH